MPEDNASWYARKLGQMRTPQGFQRQPVPQYQQPVSPYQQNTQQFSPESRELHEIQQPASTPETLSELLAMQGQGQGPKAGKGGRLNADPCPACGGNLYYHDLGKKSRGPAPAPHCFTCGYNELFEQGLESTWQGGA